MGQPSTADAQHHALAQRIGQLRERQRDDLLVFQRKTA
jgi:hypothetical protein